MRKSVLLRRIISLLLTTVVLSGLLTAGIYIFVTQRMYVQMRADELTPIARAVAEMMADAQSGGASVRSALSLLEHNDKGFLGASLHLYDDRGRSMREALFGTDSHGDPGKNFKEDNPALTAAIAPDLQSILIGGEIAGVRKSADGQAYLVVGVPIRSGSSVIGAVVLTKPMSELSEAMSGLNLTLLISTLAAFLIMLVPGYFAAKRVAVPIRRMGEVARAMAKGDFSMRADESQKGEIGELGRAVNHFAIESERLEQTRREYVANVSHELRTPIAAIRAMGETLRDGLVKSEEKQALYYGSIVRESMRLSRLVDDLLELSRLQSGTAALQKSRFDLRRVLQNVADIYSYVAEEAGLRFVLDVNMDEASPVFSSPDRIEQVLVILLDNAMKHTASGTISLKTAWRSEFIEISVIDTGEGIPEADIPHIFERFYKVDKSHSGGGTGLGLSLAHEIMSGLGETIRAESSPAGSRFTLTVHRQTHNP